ncbi:MAG: group 1 glycosyl transferase [Bacteroidetes bacterium]|nr:MAG: group 1 glycosyl transferase [Bacteroidota bacterium]
MTQKKKVVIIGSAYPLRGGGISTFNERLANAYLERGDEVIIFTFSLQYPNFLFPGTTQYSAELPPENIDIRVRINSINPFTWVKTAIEIRHFNPDIAVVRFWIPFMAPCLGTISRIIRLKGKTRIIAITDNIIPHERRIGDFRLVQYFVNSVDGFIAMSKSVLNDLNKFDKLKPKAYHPHPLYDNFGEPIPKEEAKLKLKLSKSQHYILFFGFIRDYKGLDLLLEAFNSKRLQDLELKLLIAGEFYGNEEKYLGLINKYNLADFIELRASFIPNTEVYLYFCACDIVVQPYKNATQSGVTQIAYHFGKPMITTDVGGLSEVVPDGKVGYVVQPDARAIENAIYKFYSESREKEFIENVRTERDRFSWSNLLDLIDRL